MLGRRLWTEEEVGKLRSFYVSGRPFEEIDSAFPNRTANAIRQKASRLGLRRPTASHSLLDSQAVIRCSDGNGDEWEYLFKCSVCGSWIHVNLTEEDEDRTIICRKCHAVLKYVA
jgi:DNA-directed RNA polymerase subunit RPC12/RpoP